MRESVEAGAGRSEGQKVVLSSSTWKGVGREERTPGPERPRVRAEIVCAPEQAAQRKPRRGRVTCGGGGAAGGGAGLGLGPAGVERGGGFRSRGWNQRTWGTESEQRSEPGARETLELWRGWSGRQGA